MKSVRIHIDKKFIEGENNMKKLLSGLMAFAMLFSVTGCSSKETTTSDATTTESSITEETDEEKQLEEDKAELSSIGEVEVENGILTVSVTVPSSLVSDTTQESLDESAGTNYLSATLNEDGSVTYKMTKAQHKLMLQSLSDGIDTTIQELINSDQYTITAVTHNDDFTQFDITVSGTEVGLYDTFSALSFYMYGGMYGIFSGKQADKVVVNFYDPSGNLIESGDSSSMGQ